jgi:hypothetical protein
LRQIGREKNREFSKWLLIEECSIIVKHTILGKMPRNPELPKTVKV